MNNINTASSSTPGSRAQRKVREAIVLGIGLLAAVSGVTAAPLGGVSGGLALTSARPPEHTEHTNLTTVAPPTPTGPSPEDLALKFTIICLLAMFFVVIPCLWNMWQCFCGEIIGDENDLHRGHRCHPRGHDAIPLEEVGREEHVLGGWVDMGGDENDLPRGHRGHGAIPLGNTGCENDGVVGEWVDMGGGDDPQSTHNEGAVENEKPLDGNDESGEEPPPEESTPLLFKHTGRKKQKSYS